MATSTASEAQQRAHKILFDSWRRTASYFPSGFVEEQHGLLVAATGLPWAANNPAFVLQESIDPTAALTWALERRGGLGTGFDLPQGQHLRTERALEQLGHRIVVARPMMLAPTSRMDAVLDRAPRILQLGRATDPGLVTEIATIQARAFGSTVEWEEAQLPAAQLADPNSYVAVGRIAGASEIVSVAVGVRTIDGIAIFGVATDPTHQGKGFGSATTAHAVRALDPSAPVAVLQSTAAGFPVYRSMGFDDIGSWTVWSAPEEHRGDD